MQQLPIAAVQLQVPRGGAYEEVGLLFAFPEKKGPLFQSGLA